MCDAQSVPLMLNNRRRAGYLLAWAAAAIYLWRFAGRGWIPHDDGMLAQIAERILAGQLPHRDFDDPYTGGLGYLHAMAFLVFGARILSLRIVLFLAALAWIPAVFAVARRFVSPSSAAFVTAAAVAWTMPNYFASMPSYYNLFFATWGTAALLRHLDTNSRIWLFVAGLCGGLSFLVKSSGLYFVGAAIIFLLYREQLQQRSTAERSLAVFVAKTAFGLFFVTGLAGLVVAHPGTTEFLHFFVPGAALIAVLLWTEWSDGRGRCERAHARSRSSDSAIPRWSAAARRFVYHAVRGDGLRECLVPRSLRCTEVEVLLGGGRSAAAHHHGGGTSVRLGARRRCESLARARPPLGHCPARTAQSSSRCWQLRAAPPAHLSLIWYSVRHLALPIVLAGCVLLVSGRSAACLCPGDRNCICLRRWPHSCHWCRFRSRPPSTSVMRRRFCCLQRWRWSDSSSTRHHWVHSVVLGSYLLFAVIWTNTNYVWTLGTSHVRYNFVGASILPRAGITMMANDRVEYANVVALIQQAQWRQAVHLRGPGLSRGVLPFRDQQPDSQPVRVPESPHEGPLRRSTCSSARRLTWSSSTEVPDFRVRWTAGLPERSQRRYPYSAEAGRFLVRWRL